MVEISASNDVLLLHNCGEIREAWIFDVTPDVTLLLQQWSRQAKF